jgi:hypothetical protein
MEVLYQLSYIGKFSGAVDESRTRDLNLGKVALYQLSYYRTFMEPAVGFEPTTPNLQGWCSTN